jgi:hypothetical protein
MTQSADSYTFIYLSSPSEPIYEADFGEPLHVELKRRAVSMPVRRAKNETDWNNLPLFEKYQFFTPGMGFFCPAYTVDSNEGR